MIFATEVFKHVPEKERDTFYTVTRLMIQAAQNRDKMRGKEYTNFECHSICRAVWLELADPEVSLVDGFLVGLIFGPECKVEFWQCYHSWLRLGSGAILDPYPVGHMSLSPIILAESDTLRPFTTARYRPDEEVTQKISGRDMWRKSRVIQSLFARSTLP